MGFEVEEVGSSSWESREVVGSTRGKRSTPNPQLMTALNCGFGNRVGKSELGNMLEW